MSYTLKLINGEDLTVNADGYDVYHNGKLISFYIVNGRGDKNKVLDVVMSNVLYMVKD